MSEPKKNVLANLDRGLVERFCGKGNEHFAAELELQNTLRPLLDAAPDDGSIAKLDLNEFKNLGYLQEVNRIFFHPLGLALSVEVDDKTGDVISLHSIWDDRGDPEGFMFADGDLEEEKTDFIAREFEKRSGHREQILGAGRFLQLPDDKVDDAIAGSEG